MVLNERISRGIVLRMAGAEQRNGREPKLVYWMKKGEDSAGAEEQRNRTGWR